MIFERNITLDKQTVRSLRFQYIIVGDTMNFLKDQIQTIKRNDPAIHSTLEVFYILVLEHNYIIKYLTFST